MTLWRWCGLSVIGAALIVLFPGSALFAATHFPCTTCHADKMRDKLDRAVHMADAGECDTCHQPVAGLRHPREKSSITVPPPRSADLCYRCHKRVTAEVVHAPVAAGECTVCHVPHRTPGSSLLKKKGADLCFMCHQRAGFTHRYGHGPVKGGNCLYCHDPHGSGSKKLLRKFGAGLCFDCHDRALEVGESVHEPVGYGECWGCHAIHGSQHRQLLKGNFDEEMYFPYERSRYELCFLCHRPELAEAQTTELTGFRNGHYNLHFLHVNKGDRGRSCKACHDPHKAEQPRLVMPEVPGFGTWSIPMFFTVTSNGGTCVVGCHKPKTYDRIEPVTY